MKNKNTSIIFVLFLIVGAMSGCIFDDDDENFIFIYFDEERAYSDEVFLTEIGPRLTGTEQEHQGAEYILSQFQEAGLQNTQIEEYELTCYEVNSAQCSLIEYDSTTGIETSDKNYEHETDFIVQGYSGSLNWNNQNDDLEVVDVGNGSDESAYSDVQGKAVIVTTEGELSFTEKFIQAWENGASANILHNIDRNPHYEYSAFSFSASAEDERGHLMPLPDAYPENDYPDIPTFMVSKAIGDEIKSKTENASTVLLTGEPDVKVRVDFDVIIEKRPLNVVVGEITGTKNKDDYVMVGAHHDTVYVSPGAVDNTVGPVTVMEMARQMVKYKPEVTIKFATFGGEEEGLLGSYEYFKGHEQEVNEHMKFFFNLDMNNVYLERGNNVPMGFNNQDNIDVMEKIRGKFYNKFPEYEKYNITFYFNEMKGGSDQATFAIEGKEVSACWGAGCWEYHMKKDTIEYINPESLGISGRIVAAFLLWLTK